MARPVVTQIEMHVTHACNLTCSGCSHFSNEGMTGRETPESFRASLEPWSKRLAPSHFLILGGEPTLNPDLSEIIGIARELLPDTNMMLVTNGWFLHKHKDLPSVLKEGK